VQMTNQKLDSSYPSSSGQSSSSFSGSGLSRSGSSGSGLSGSGLSGSGSRLSGYGHLRVIDNGVVDLTDDGDDDEVQEGNKESNG
jgi:hypothetical protein